MKLTKMEKMVLNAMRENDYADTLQDDCNWAFVATEYSGLETKQARGALSSLIKKGLVAVEKQSDDEDCICFTEKGEQIWKNTDGEECSWGGPRLFKIEDDTEGTNENTQEDATMREHLNTLSVKELKSRAKAAGVKGSISRMKKDELIEAICGTASSTAVKVKVQMLAFTGMVIGEFEGTMEDGYIIVSTASKGELAFDAESGKEVNIAKDKARYANKILVL